MDSTWMWEFVNEVDDDVKRCQQNQFGCDPKTFWADGEPADGVTQYMFGVLNVNNPAYPDPYKNWVAGTGEGGNQVGYICGPKVEDYGCHAYFLKSISLLDMLVNNLI